MNSSTSRTNATKQTQEDIKRKIAELQSFLLPEVAEEPKQQTLEKRKIREDITLAPPTPSPKKKRKLEEENINIRGKVLFPSAVSQQKSLQLRNSPDEEKYKNPLPSNFISKLVQFSRNVNTEPTDDVSGGIVDSVIRSNGFEEKPKVVSSQSLMDEETSVCAVKRDENLALVDEFEPGPYDHKPPLDDPDFKKLEPHSGIHLSSRLVSHEDFSDYLRGRFYISPSRLYGCIRLLPDQKGYDVPVPGDWVTVAVVAERGPVKFTRAPIPIEKEHGEDNKHRKGKRATGTEEDHKPTGKKYVNLKLIDFGARSSGSLSTASGKSAIRGDAFLTLLIFESEGYDLLPREDNGRPEKIYKGGSRGAFERLSDVREGDVVALLNPKILKPFQKANSEPHPHTTPLALTPASASCILVLGRARDIGMCTVRKKDGRVCGSWCDKRISGGRAGGEAVCEYHLENAVKQRRSARPEFSIGTSGLTTTSTHKSKYRYDPARQWGLKPEPSSSISSATYVVSASSSMGMFLSEDMGRESQAKARRKNEGRDQEKALIRRLVDRDREGMKEVVEARRVGAEVLSAKEKGKAKGKPSKGKRNAEKEKEKEDVDLESDENSEECDVDLDGRGDASKTNSKEAPTSYSIGIIRSLGFDPSLKPGHKRNDTVAGGMLEKLEALQALRKKRTIDDKDLGHRPGPRIRSGVFAPIKVSAPGGAIDMEDEDELHLSPDDKLEEDKIDARMVDLDDD